jgi:tight adherence protein C
LTIDLISLATSAGVAPQQAVALAALWGPSGTAAVLARVDHATRVGTPFRDALTSAGAAHPVVAPLMEVLVLGDSLGAPAGASLDRLAAEARADIRRDAEARARVVPVKLLFPLVFLVLPAFGLLTVVPALLASLQHT